MGGNGANGHAGKPFNAAEELAKWRWEPQPVAQKLVNDMVALLTGSCAWSKGLSERMLKETGTRFVDWVDHIQIPKSMNLKARATEAGWKAASGELAVAASAVPNGAERLVNELGMFPEVYFVDGDALRIGIKVEFVADFLATHDMWDANVIGEAGGQLRIATVGSSKRNGGGTVELLAVERHGYRGLVPPAFDAHKSARHAHHLELLRRRRRHGDESACWAHAEKLVDDSIKEIGRDWTCDAFYAGERDYWMKRNRAAQVQFGRQQKLGLGWANHDHHTYRSSRDAFTRLVRLWEKLGLYCRERFYAGHGAQWGAQVMEQAVTGIITFNDVDMSPEELLGDFSHVGFTEQRDKLGTVGLWCGLHGEAVLGAGMHHLEAMFDWHALVEQLEKEGGVKTMAPFTTFPYLRQAFTEGERWDVREERIKPLLDKAFITPEQADKFRVEGALGSHLENLERNDGFKGFNQEGVSDIIARTDPRRQGAVAKAH